MSDSMKTPLSSAASTETIPKTLSLAAASGEDPYDRLLHILRDMQSEIENQVRPIAQRAIDLEVQRLREQAAINEQELSACLERIDRCVSACIQHAHEYRRELAELAGFNGRLAALGSPVEPLPKCPGDITEIISSRLKWLRVQQKL